MSSVRCTIVFRGRVQGVFFRQTTWECAKGRPVTGWVRNERDGSVLMVAEGTRSEIECVLEDLRQQKAGSIDSKEVKWGEATGEFAGFEIRY